MFFNCVIYVCQHFSWDFPNQETNEFIESSSDLAMEINIFFCHRCLSFCFVYNHPNFKVLLLKTLGEESNSSNTGNTTFNYGIISNKVNESVQKSAVINERIIAENTRAKPKAQRKSTQELLILCKRKIDKLFLNFTKDLAVKLKYEPLFDDMKTLKCFFVSFHLFYICILISLHLWNSAQIFRIF